MSKDYKDYSMDEIAEEYQNGKAGISLEELAEIYHFPSVDILVGALTKYNKEHRKGRLKRKPNFSIDQKKYITYLYTVKKHSIKKIADMADTSIYNIEKILREENVITHNKTTKVPGKTNLKSTEVTTNSKIIPQDEKKELATTIRKIEIPVDELAEAVKNNKIGKVVEKYNTSYSTVRKRLIETYGNNYLDLLRREALREELEEYKTMYEDGMSGEQIAEIKEVDIKEAKRKISYYYKLQGIKRPKILSKKLFEERMNMSENADIEKVILEFSKVNIHIPEPYIKEYYKKIDGIDLRQVKNIVCEQLTQIQNNGKVPNYTSPFNFANKVKEQGYGTKYQACAILYKIIEENDLSSDIVLPLDNDNLTEAINLLTDKTKINNPEYMGKLKNNNLAYVIYSMQMQNSNSNTEKSLDD